MIYRIVFAHARHGTRFEVEIRAEHSQLALAAAWKVLQRKVGDQSREWDHVSTASDGRQDEDA
jgi:hypothetical protein